MLTKTQSVDGAAIKKAIEGRDGRMLASFYADDALRILLELRLVGLRSVEDRARHAGHAGHRDRFLDLFVRRAVELGGLGVEIDAVLARYLRGHREAHQFLGLAVERGLGVELHALDLGPGAGNRDIRQRLEHVRHRAERRLDVLVSSGRRGVLGLGGGDREQCANACRYHQRFDRPV